MQEIQGNTMDHHGNQSTGDRPALPGWNENPTAWPKRERLIVLASAAVSFDVLLSVSEPQAAFQHLRGVRRKGGPVREALWGREGCGA